METRAEALRTVLDWLPVAGLRFSGGNGPDRAELSTATWKTQKCANGLPLVARAFRPRLTGFDPDVRATRTGVSARTPALQTALSRQKARPFEYDSVYLELLKS